jgi:hypothetical protein
LSNAITVNVNGIQNRTGIENILIAPNPVFDALHVTLNSNELITKVIIYNAAGAILLEKHEVNNKTIIIDVKNFSAGAYVVSVQTETGVFSKNVNVVK